MDERIDSQEATVALQNPKPQPIAATPAAKTDGSATEDRAGGIKVPKRAVKRKEDEDASSSMSDRLRKKTDLFRFDGLLSLASTSDAPFPPADMSHPYELYGDATSAVGASPREESPALPVSAATAKPEQYAGSDVTLRLVEQLTRTNERLEKLEETLQQASLLAALQQEPHLNHDSAAQDMTGRAAGDADSGKRAHSEKDVEAEAIFRSGVALCQMKKFDEAVAAWKQVLCLQPDNAFAIANIGIVYTEQGRWAEARDMFAHVLRLQPDNAEACYGMGMADAQLGNYTAAMTALENTLRLQPDNADARYNLALVKQRKALTDHAARNRVQNAEEDSSISQKSAESISSAASHEAQSGSPVMADKSAARQSLIEQATAPGVSSPQQAAEEELSQRVQIYRNDSPAAQSSRSPAKKQSGFVRLGIAAVAVLALAGALFYNQYSAGHPANGSGGAPPARGTTVGSSAGTETVTIPTPKPVVNPSSAAVTSATTTRTSVKPSKPHESATGTTSLQPRTTVIQNRPRRPRVRTFAITQYPVKSRVPRQHGGASAATHSASGFNKGVDKIMDQMP